MVLITIINDIPAQQDRDPEQELSGGVVCCHTYCTCHSSIVVSEYKLGISGLVGRPGSRKDERLQVMLTQLPEHFSFFFNDEICST